MWSFGKTWSELEKGGVSKEMADIGHRRLVIATVSTLHSFFLFFKSLAIASSIAGKFSVDKI